MIPSTSFGVVQTYLEMNVAIKKFLGESDDPMKQYAALRIEELERENDALREQVVFLSAGSSGRKGGSDVSC